MWLLLKQFITLAPSSTPLQNLLLCVFAGKGCGQDGEQKEGGAGGDSEDEEEGEEGEEGGKKEGAEEGGDASRDRKRRRSGKKKQLSDMLLYSVKLKGVYLHK